MTGLVIVVAGGFGAGLRSLVSVWTTRRSAGGFPWGTGVVNSFGSLLLGFVVGVGANGLVLAALAGMLSGFTTYSTWMVETVSLWTEGGVGRVRAAANWIALLAVGLLLAGFGLVLGKTVR